MKNLCIIALLFSLVGHLSCPWAPSSKADCDHKYCGRKRSRAPL